MAHAESSTLPVSAGTPDSYIEAVLGKIHEAPVEQRELLARDAFIEGGYRRLASNMISLAIRDLVREPKVPPTGKNKAARDAQEAREWINGANSDLSFMDCLGALGMEQWSEGLRQFILENPENAAELFRAYERSYYEHLDPAMSTGLPESAADDLDGDDPLDVSRTPILGRKLNDAIEQDRYRGHQAGGYPLQWMVPHSEATQNLRLPTFAELGVAAAVGAQDAQRQSLAEEGWSAEATETMRPH